jgi:hypothetical protein
MDIITIIGLSVIFFYCISKVFSFYGVGKSSYLVYMFFYLYMAFCVAVLPTEINDF